MAESDRKTEMLKDLLECPICFEISKPPIYCCVVGHLICKDCSPKVGVCPICRGRYTGTRNFTAEDLYTKLVGDNSFEEGESSKTKSKSKSKYDQHPLSKLDQAYMDLKFTTDTLLDSLGEMGVREDPDEFRPIKCCLSTDECKNSIMDFFSYMDHLKEVHKVVYGGDGISQFTKKQNTKGHLLVKNGSSKVFIMNCFERQFLISMHQEGQFVWVWTALHGPAEETDGYIVRLVIASKDVGDISWTGKVHGIRKTFEQVCASGACLKISTEDLRRRLINRFFWLVQAEISRANANSPGSSLSLNAVLNSAPSSSASASAQPLTLGASFSIRNPTSPQLPQLPPPRPRPPVPRSLSSGQIRQPLPGPRNPLSRSSSIKGPPPPLPAAPPVVTRLSAFSNSSTAQAPPVRPSIAISQSRSAQQLADHEERLRALFTTTRNIEIGGFTPVFHSPLLPLRENNNASTSSNANSSASARSRASSVPSYVPSAMPVKKGKDSCIIL